MIGRIHMKIQKGSRLTTEELFSLWPDLKLYINRAPILKLLKLWGIHRQTHKHIDRKGIS
jgi:hypothetical protein